MDERIVTLHPQGKTGVNISKDKYAAIRQAILKVLQSDQEVTFTDLTNRVSQQLEDRFEGSIPWYVTTVKLDLEARGEIQRVPGSSPQRLRLAGVE